MGQEKPAPVMRRWAANRLRRLATWLDGVQTIELRWHQTNVRTMNAYIKRTEEYIRALEDYLEPSCVACEGLLHLSDAVPHCEDCNIPDELLEAYRPFPGIEAFRREHDMPRRRP